MLFSIIFLFDNINSNKSINNTSNCTTTTFIIILLDITTILGYIIILTNALFPSILTKSNFIFSVKLIFNSESNDILHYFDCLFIIHGAIELSPLHTSQK